MSHPSPLLARSIAALGIAIGGIAIGASAQETAPRGGHVHTDRAGAHLIQKPTDEKAFTFAVYGDRTGGRPEGLEVLRQAVADTNLIDPDLVMTVGDLVQGYNTTAEWKEEVVEFKGIMDDLEMAWFPVAGNHDIYFRGENRPKFHHEESYETWFGPLWYAFTHRDCLFVALYSDEGDRETGAKAFNRPELQRMSPEQFAWLDKTLDDHADKRHVFVFLHHPRWLGGGYGDDWDRVHERLAAAGNVRAVFAGHIHRMRYDGDVDGIEYFTLATTGGALSMEVPEAGYLHHFHLVTVREEKLSVAAVPVGAVLDPRQITGAISAEIAQLNSALRPAAEPLQLDGNARLRGTLELEFLNPCSRPIELVIATDPVGGFYCHPGHVHLTVEPRQKGTATLQVTRAVGDWTNLQVPELRITCDYLAEGLRISLPEREIALPIAPPRQLVEQHPNGAVRVGHEGVIVLDAQQASIADGPLTIEAWILGDADGFAGRTGLATKTENSEFGLFVSDGRLDMSVHLNGRYVTGSSADGALQPGTWHHVAGVYDGATVRAFIDGKLAGEAVGSGNRTVNNLPLVVGGDVDRRGNPTSPFRGLIDDFRLSTTARYGAEGFAPPKRLEADEHTFVLLAMDQPFGPWFADGSGNGVHGRVRGRVPIEGVSR